MRDTALTKNAIELTVHRLVDSARIHAYNAHRHYHHHAGHQHLIVISICLTLILVAGISAFVILRWQNAKIAAAHAERHENFQYKATEDERNATVAIERETRQKADEDLRKKRDFIIMLIDKVKVKTEITKPADSTKTEEKQVSENIDQAFLSLLIRKLEEISF